MSLLILSLVEIALGISVIATCFEYRDLAERYRLKNRLSSLAERYPEYYGPVLSSWSSKSDIVKSQLGKLSYFIKLLQNFCKPFSQPLTATSCFSTLVLLTWIRVTLEPIWTSQVELGSKHKVETGNGKQSKIKTQLRNWGRQT